MVPRLYCSIAGHDYTADTLAAPYDAGAYCELLSRLKLLVGHGNKCPRLRLNSEKGMGGAIP